MASYAMVVSDVESFGSLIFDLDGVIMRTAMAHARAWKQLFDEYLARRAARTGELLVPFDIDGDYRRYVDGKPRQAGARSATGTSRRAVRHRNPRRDAATIRARTSPAATTGWPRRSRAAPWTS